MKKIERKLKKKLGVKKYTQKPLPSFKKGHEK